MRGAADWLDPSGVSRPHGDPGRRPFAPSPQSLRPTTTGCERTCPWARTRQLIDRSKGLVGSSRGRSSACYITNIAGSNFGRDRHFPAVASIGPSPVGTDSQADKSLMRLRLIGIAPWNTRLTEIDDERHRRDQTRQVLQS